MFSDDLTTAKPQRKIMTNGSKPLIHLEGVTKVFLTDEVETHALSGIHLDIATGEYVSIAETVRGFKEILDGKHDEVPEQNFYMKGGIDMIQEEG